MIAASVTFQFSPYNVSAEPRLVLSHKHQASRLPLAVTAAKGCNTPITSETRCLHFHLTFSHSPQLGKQTELSACSLLCCERFVAFSPETVEKGDVC